MIDFDLIKRTGAEEERARCIEIARRWARERRDGVWDNGYFDPRAKTEADVLDDLAEEFALPPISL